RLYAGRNRKHRLGSANPSPLAIAFQQADFREVRHMGKADVGVSGKTMYAPAAATPRSLWPKGSR
ncbi:MAG TPA: hypothetical protein VG897_11985, partial [Terriglobales bacterium]|nr:hypothetical protein [Terriglobales bacterium]